MWYCKFAVCSVLLPSRVDASVSLVRITTIPAHGPFRVRQRVQFSCMLETPQSTPVTYQWRSVEDVYGGSRYSGDSVNKSFYANNLRYCWFSCTVTLNQTLLGSADKLIEVQGKSFTGKSARSCCGGV